MTQTTELSAAYERINELEGTLTEIRALYKAGEHDGSDGEFDPFDIAEKAVCKIDMALEPRIVSAPPG